MTPPAGGGAAADPCPGPPAPAAGWTACCRYGGHDVRVPARYRPGGGELLVLLHGLGCSQDSFDGAFEAEGLLRYSILTLDLPGHGACEHGQPGALHTLEAFADITESAIGQLAERTGQPHDLVHLAGHSMGGAVIVILARRRPRPGRTVSIDGNLTAEDCGLVSRAVAGQSLASYAGGGHSRLVADLLQQGRPAQAAWAGWLARADPAAVHAAARSLVGWSDSGDLLTWFSALPDTAFVHGDQEDKRHLTGRLGQAVTHRLPGCGHFPMTDNPALLYETLARVLTSENRGSGDPEPARGGR